MRRVLLLIVILLTFSAQVDAQIIHDGCVSWFFSNKSVKIIPQPAPNVLPVPEQTYNLPVKFDPDGNLRGKSFKGMNIKWRLCSDYDFVDEDQNGLTIGYSNTWDMGGGSSGIPEGTNLNQLTTVLPVRIPKDHQYTYGKYRLVIETEYAYVPFLSLTCGKNGVKIVKSEYTMHLDAKLAPVSGLYLSGDGVEKTVKLDYSRLHHYSYLPIVRRAIYSNHRFAVPIGERSVNVTRRVAEKSQPYHPNDLTESWSTSAAFSWSGNPHNTYSTTLKVDDFSDGNIYLTSYSSLSNRTRVTESRPIVRYVPKPEFTIVPDNVCLSTPGAVAIKRIVGATEYMWEIIEGDGMLQDSEYHYKTSRTILRTPLPRVIIRSSSTNTVKFRVRAITPYDQTLEANNYRFDRGEAFVDYRWANHTVHFGAPSSLANFTASEHSKGCNRPYTMEFDITPIDGADTYSWKAYAITSTGFVHQHSVGVSQGGLHLFFNGFTLPSFIGTQDLFLRLELTVTNSCGTSIRNFYHSYRPRRCGGPGDGIGILPQMKLADENSKKALDTPEFEVIAYPNPATNLLFVNLQGDEEVNGVRLLDVTGKEVQTANIRGDVAEFNVVELAAGIYIVRVQLANGTFVSKKVAVK